jgi:hypothetical protein
MGIMGFLQSVADNFRQRYADLAEQIRVRQPVYRDFSPQETKSAPAPEVEDTFTPSGPADAAYADESPDSVELSGSQPEDTPAPPNSSETDTATPPAEHKDGVVEQKPDGTYVHRRAARLDYSLNLRFDLAAVQRTVRLLSEGDTETIEQLVAAGFGLSAAFDLKGMSLEETAVAGPASDAHPVHARTLNMLKSRQANQFAADSRNFALDSFSRESSKLMRSHDELARNGYRRAVNRFAMRYRMDTQFSFGFLQRFNIQTDRVAADAPESLDRYVDTAGAVAEGGSVNMMATFFDAVDAYLNAAESDLLDKALGAFDQAVADLGFSDALAGAVRDHLSDTIEGFFDRVDLALAGMREQFGIENATATDNVEIPQVEPSVIDKPTVDPAVLQDRESTSAGV